GQFWQHQIENDEIGSVVARLLQTGCTVGGCRGLETSLVQTHLEKIRNVALVFDDQDFSAGTGIHRINQFLKSAELLRSSGFANRAWDSLTSSAGHLFEWVVNVDRIVSDKTVAPLFHLLRTPKEAFDILRGGAPTDERPNAPHIELVRRPLNDVSRWRR